MMLSDYLCVRSVHELLLVILASELGLLGVSTSESQRAALEANFEKLKASTLAGLREDLEISLPFGGNHKPVLVPVPGRAEGELFIRLYKGLNQYVDAHSMMEYRVAPLITEVVLKNPQIKEELQVALRAHIEKYGPAVGNRIVNTLGAFGIYGVSFDLPQSFKLPA